MDVLLTYVDYPQAFVILLSLANPDPQGVIETLMQQLAEGEIICPVLYELLDQCEQVRVSDVHRSLLHEDGRVVTLFSSNVLSLTVLCSISCLLERRDTPRYCLNSARPASALRCWHRIHIRIHICSAFTFGQQSLMVTGTRYLL